MPTSEYDILLDVIAEHPGASRNELRVLVDGDDHAVDPDAVDNLLDNALDRGDVLEANGSHWVMRTGRFHPDEYDHLSTGEWRDDSGSV